MHLYPPLSVDLMRRLGCLNQVRFQGMRPRDGGDYFDTFEGWQKRGRRVRKGGVSLRRHSDLDPARFPFHETLPAHGHRNATR
jgi:hypothetical protein